MWEGQPDPLDVFVGWDEPRLFPGRTKSGRGKPRKMEGDQAQPIGSGLGTNVLINFLREAFHRFVHRTGLGSISIFHRETPIPTDTRLYSPRRPCLIYVYIVVCAAIGFRHLPQGLR